MTILEVNPLLLGGLPAGLVIISTKRKQRIGDLLAGTLVVPNEIDWDQHSTQAPAKPELASETAE
jgi:uncharacterized RDD family membrane protein YckC